MPPRTASKCMSAIATPFRLEQRAGGQCVRSVVNAPLTGGDCAMSLAAAAAIGCMEGDGMPVACWCSSLPTEMETFLMTLELGGLTIALIGLRRERWLRRRRR